MQIEFPLAQTVVCKLGSVPERVEAKHNITKPVHLRNLKVQNISEMILKFHMKSSISSEQRCGKREARVNISPQN